MANNSEASELRMFALHGHWVTAGAIRQVMFADGDTAESAVISAEIAQVAHSLSAAMRMCVFYALIYVVVEGYQEQATKDPGIDALLTDGEKVALLRRFRNAVFHPQNNPMSAKLRGFIEAEGTSEWIMRLNRALDAYFAAWRERHPLSNLSRWDESE